MNKLGAPKGKYKRWHRYRLDGTKEMKSFEIGIDPTNKPIEAGYSSKWILGSGPLPEENYKNLLKAIDEKVRNIPKSQETREKMRIAKLGVPKTPEHKENMRKARYRVLARTK